VLCSFAAADFFLQGWHETAGILPYFKVENMLAGKKIKAKPGFSLWRTAQGRFFFLLGIGLLQFHPNSLEVNSSI